MTYPVSTSAQLRAVLRALRQSRSLTQAQAGALLGVNQRRTARIEGNPGVTNFAQIARLVSALGGRLVVEVDDLPVPKQPNVPARNSRKSRTVSTTKNKSIARAKSASDMW